jgi:hypothetical protein
MTDYTDLSELGEVVRAYLGPDDVIVLRSQWKLSDEAKDSMTEKLRGVFPDNKIVVLDEGLDLMLVGPDDRPIFPENKQMLLHPDGRLELRPHD